MRSLIVAAVVLISLGACSEQNATSNPPEASCASESPIGEVSFGTGSALIDTAEGSQIVKIEIADSPEERALGLMNRPSLGDDCGMAFLFFAESSGGFWMKNTLIPLSIAFFDEQGEVLKLLDMDPCEADPCTVYDPGASYWGALEVNRGAFDEWGVAEGDRITINQ